MKLNSVLLKSVKLFFFYLLYYTVYIITYFEYSIILKINITVYTETFA